MKRNNMYVCFYSIIIENCVYVDLLHREKNTRKETIKEKYSDIP